MTKLWFNATTTFRAPFQPAAPRPVPGYDVLQRRMERLGSRREAVRSAPIEAPPLPLDFHLLEDGAALEAAWQEEMRTLIAFRRGGPARLQAAREARTASETIVRRIEQTRAMTLDGLKVKARAESWRRNGEPLAAEKAESEQDDGVWTDMADMPSYDAPASAPAFA